MNVRQVTRRAYAAARRRTRKSRAVQAAVDARLLAAERSRPRSIRLVPEPVFVLSYMRSGSTLLRVILDSHSQICAPHEMHLRELKVTAEGVLSQASLAEFRLTERQLENMLWDRILFDRQLVTGKPIIVDKTPVNTMFWRRLHWVWPEAKFIFLYRHPVPVMDSWSRANPDIAREQSIPQLMHFVQAMEKAREVHGGLVVRYEDLTREPEETTREICEFLGVPWEPEMIDYGAQDHGKFVRGLGDWHDKIKSGTILPAPPNPRPEDVPDDLKEIARLMGYL